MKHLIRPRIAASALVVLCTLVTAGAALFAQGQPPGGNDPLGPAGVSPGEVQRLFDAYALMQAQDQLKLSAEQWPAFLTRMKALQDVRRRSQADRNRILQDLRRATQPANEERVDESQLRERLKTLQELDSRSAADLVKAYDAIDQILDVRQQARFRVLEEQMERRKIELLMRARQANRPKRP